MQFQFNIFCNRYIDQDPGDSIKDPILKLCFGGEPDPMRFTGRREDLVIVLKVELILDLFEPFGESFALYTNKCGEVLSNDIFRLKAQQVSDGCTHKGDVGLRVCRINDIVDVIYQVEEFGFTCGKG